MRKDESREGAAALADRIRNERPNDIEDGLLDDAPADYTGRNPTVPIQRDELLRFRHSYVTLSMFAALLCGKAHVSDVTFQDLLDKLDAISGVTPTPFIPPDAEVIEPFEPSEAIDGRKPTGKGFGL
jgi:hypothetical protein